MQLQYKRFKITNNNELQLYVYIEQRNEILKNLLVQIRTLIHFYNFYFGTFGRSRRHFAVHAINHVYLSHYTIF